LFRFGFRFADDPARGLRLDARTALAGFSQVIHFEDRGAGPALQKFVERIFWAIHIKRSGGEFDEAGEAGLDRLEFVESPAGVGLAVPSVLVQGFASLADADGPRTF